MKEKKFNLALITIFLFVILLIIIISWMFISKTQRNSYKTKFDYFTDFSGLDFPIHEEEEYKIVKTYDEYKQCIYDVKEAYSQIENYIKLHYDIIYDETNPKSIEYFNKFSLIRSKNLDKVINFLDNEKYDEEYFENNNLLILSIEDKENASIKIKKINFEKEKMNIYIDIEYANDLAISDTYVYMLDIKKEKMENVTKIQIKSQVKDITAANGMAYKPIIYLYPTEETQVNVQLGNKEQITCSYPKYTIGWNVIAQPNGDLKDIDTNKNLYSLYYESDNVVEFKVEKDGFVVKGEDSAEFLEEKLKILGITDREAEEFIIYWLPKLEANKYNYIRFATREEIDANMPLTIKPEPDTTIRVLMEYKGLENSIKVEEQSLETPKRKGFVAVEWGGIEIK